MSADSGVSASNLAGTTPGSEALKTHPKPISEAEYLQQQADDAAKAMSRVVHLVGKELGDSIDPRGLTRSHPWIAMSIAAAGGFLAVNLVPKAEDREVRRQHRRMNAHRRNRRRRIIRELREAGIIGHDVQEKVGILHRLFEEAITVVRQAVLSAVMGAVGGNDNRDNHDNRPPDAAPPPPATTEAPDRTV